jgi:hypothetical protein
MLASGIKRNLAKNSGGFNLRIALAKSSNDLGKTIAWLGNAWGGHSLGGSLGDRPTFFLAKIYSGR